MADKLNEYRAKRDTSASGEPTGGDAGGYPRYLGLRDDKALRDVVREEPR